MGEFTLLEYIVQQLATVASRIVCVGLPPNTLELRNVQFIADEQPDRGPLEGMRLGLKSVAEQHDYAYVTACDSPFPQANVIQFLKQQIADHESALPASATHVYGLSGLYRTDTHVKIADLVDSDQLRVSGLATALDSKLIPLDQMLSVDPDLKFVYNVNRPEEYLNLIEQLNLSCSEQVRRLLRKQPGT